jgi:hypothetical protein
MDPVLNPQVMLLVLSALPAPSRPGATPAPGGVRLDEAVWIGSHNTYAHGAHLVDALDDGVNAIEIDIWDDGATSLLGIGQDEQERNWYVRHFGDIFHGGNDNNCGGGNRSFDACLDDLRAWHDAHPGHPLVLVFIDKKQGWGGSRMPQDFDALLAQRLDGRAGGCADATAPSLLVTPAALRASARTLRQAAERQQLPSVSALRGKFMFVLTALSLSEYVEAQQAQACALVAPEIYHHQVQSNVVHGTPPAFSTRTQEWVIFYNINYSQLAGYVGAPYHTEWAMGDEIRRWHYLSRVYAVPGTLADYRSARTDSPDADDATTDNGNNVIVLENFERVVGALGPETAATARMAGEAPVRTPAAPAP